MPSVAAAAKAVNALTIFQDCVSCRHPHRSHKRNRMPSDACTIRTRKFRTNRLLKRKQMVRAHFFVHEAASFPEFQSVSRFAVRLIGRSFFPKFDLFFDIDVSASTLSTPERPTCPRPKWPRRLPRCTRSNRPASW
jgi:hypothetical protein